MEPSTEEAAAGATHGSKGILVIHNPHSRRGRAAADHLRAEMVRRGLRTGVSWAPVDALEGAPSGLAPRRVIALGGDGTVNAASEWIIRRAAVSDLGIIPAGTGNNLATGLGIPAERARASEIALAGGRTRAIDAIRYLPLVEGSLQGAPLRPRIFIQGAAWGFPAEVAGRYAVLRRRRLFRIAAYPLGSLVYRLLALARLARLRLVKSFAAEEGFLRLQVDLAGERLEMEAIAAFAGNEPTLGGGFIPCPRASVDDGLIDLCFIRSGAGRPSLALLRQVAAGRHLSLPGVEYRQSLGPVELRFAKEEPMMADGDIWMRGRGYRLELLRGAVRVVTGR